MSSNQCFHFTYLNRANKIKEQGLVPRSEENSRALKDSAEKISFSEGRYAAAGIFANFYRVYKDIRTDKRTAENSNTDPEMIKRVKKSLSFESFLGNGMYLMFDGTDIENTGGNHGHINPFDAGTTQGISPDMLKVCTLQDRITGERTPSKYDYALYLMMSLTEEEFEKMPQSMREDIEFYKQNHQAEMARLESGDFVEEIVTLQDFCEMYHDEIAIEEATEAKRNAVRNIIENQKRALEKYKRMYEQAIEGGNQRRIEGYAKNIANTENRINDLEDQLAYVRNDNPADLEERKNASRTFSKQVASIVPDGVPMVFHGNCDINKVYEILQSGGLKTPDERGVPYKSFATQIDVANKFDIHVPVEFAEPGISSGRPYGAIFVFYPKEHEIEKGLKYFGSEVPAGVESIDFKEEDSRFVGIITTEENRARIQAWLEEFGMDGSKAFTHSEFLTMCQERFHNRTQGDGQSEITLQDLGRTMKDSFVQDTGEAIETMTSLESGAKTKENTKNNETQEEVKI